MFRKTNLLSFTVLTGFVILLAVIWDHAATAEPVYTTVSCIPPPPGMIGWWPGDGNAQDILEGNDGTLINGTSFASGHVADAFSFDGIDDGVLVPDAPILNFGAGADFSLDAWIRITPGAPDPPTNHFTILSKRFAPTALGKPTGFELYLFEGKLGIQLADDSAANGNYQNFVSFSPDLRDGNFHHVAVTIDRDVVDGGHLYVDGQVVLTFDTTLEAGDLSTTEPLRIGIHATDGFDAFFNGLIDEVEIFNRALSQGEISTIYDAGPAGKCKEFFVFLPIVINPCHDRYLDDFSNAGSGWPTDNSSNSQVEYLGSEYRILVKDTDSWAAARPGVKGSDLRISVDVHNVNSRDGSYGILFGLAEDWRQFYTFEIGSDGFYRIWRYSGSWTLLELDSSSHIHTSTASNHLQVEWNGVQIKAYANGHLLTALAEGSFTGERHVGLIASTFDQANLDARFDNFDVCSFAGPLYTTQQSLLQQTSQLPAVIGSSHSR